MAQGDFASVLQLGRPGKELILNTSERSHPHGPLSITIGRAAAIDSSLTRQGFSAIHARYHRRYNVQILGARQKVVSVLESMQGIGDSHLSFLYADDWPLYSERYGMQTTTTFTIDDNPFTRLDKAYDDLTLAAIVDNFAVFDDYHATGAQISTDRFSTYNRETRVVTILVAKTIGDIVYVNYTRIGSMVRFSSTIRTSELGFDPSTGQRTWRVQFQLETV